MTVMLPLLLVLGCQAAAQTPAPAPDPKLVRIYVQTEIGGEASDLAGKRQSVKDLMSSLSSKNKKKTLAVVGSEREADGVAEVIERSVVTPKFVMGLGPRPGESMSMTGPTRQVILRVRLTSGAVTLDFTNTNKPIESSTGWKMAADDVARQIEEWAAAHREEILKRRRASAPRHLPLAYTGMSGAAMTPLSITRRHAEGTASGTFDLELDGRPGGYLSYRLKGDATMIVEFVEVDPSMRGQGMGERLVGAAVEWARATGRQIVPHCAYARIVLTRTAAYRDVLKP